MNIRLEVLLNKIGITKKKIKAAVKEAARTEHVEKEQKMRTYLKVKIMSLGAESRIIRQQERAIKRRTKIAQSNGDARSKIFWGLREHRLHEVRPEARASCLAYGFLRGRTYRRMEQICYTKPDWAKVERIAIKYGTDERDIKQRFAQWKDEAENSAS